MLKHTWFLVENGGIRAYLYPKGLDRVLIPSFPTKNHPENHVRQGVGWGFERFAVIGGCIVGLLIHIGTCRYGVSRWRYS